jgi:hypothetical protein
VAKITDLSVSSKDARQSSEVIRARASMGRLMHFERRNITRNLKVGATDSGKQLPHVLKETKRKITRDRITYQNL